MIKKNKAYKYRIYPTEEQEILIQKTFGCVRFIWNAMLEDKIKYYKDTGKYLNNTPAQYKKSNEFLKEVDSLSLCNVQVNLGKAFKNFFKNPKKFGYPKWKSKKHSKKSYTTNNINKGTAIRLENSFIVLPKLGKTRIRLHRQIPLGNIIKSATISQKSNGNYFISILTEYDFDDSVVRILDKNRAIGLDYSSKSFYTDNQGIDANYPKYFREYETKLKKEQRKLSKMTYKSNNYNKQLKRIGKIYTKMSDSRNNWIHNKSSELSKSYDIICLEDLNLSNISRRKGLRLGKSTYDNGFGMFREYLKYKLEDTRGKLVYIDKWYPSSKRCNDCGYIYKDLKLKERSWICPGCGSIHNRDHNAALNIKEEGLRILGL